MATYDIVILGAGGVGCVVGGHLSAAGWRVQLVNRQADTARAIEENGLRLEVDAGLLVSHPNAVTTPAIRAIIPNLNPDSILVTMQNGLGNGQTIRTLVNHDVLHGVTMIPATVLAPGHIRSMGTHNSWIGPLDSNNGRQNHAAQELADMLTASGIKTTYHQDVLPPIWQKACFNIARNGVAALADASPGLIGDTPTLTNEVHLLADEALLLATTLGISVDGDSVHQLIDFACQEHRFHQPSMLQDIRSQRVTEIDALNGYVVAQATQLGLDVPRCRLIAALIQARQTAPEFWAAQ
ncbi:MAG: 2-dehydropantoate 2-reductase [Candidatus Puniceispirillum sp.]